MCHCSFTQSGNSYRENVIATLSVNPTLKNLVPYLISSSLCSGCKNLFSSDDLNECRSCNQQLCEHCSCPCNPKATQSSLLTVAKSMISSFANRNPDSVPQSLSTFVVEDEYGGLEAVHGDVSSILGAEPVIDQIFADQLAAEVAKSYETKQLAIWEKGTGAGVFFALLSYTVFILPMFVEGQRFTVTTFVSDILASGLLL